MTKAQLENRYGISIIENGYYNWQCRYIKLYDVYSADGCCWEKGFRTIKSIANECKKWSKEILAIKEKKG